ncbi:MAG: MbcA/ParS/Xre antitoxin family protein [Gammaproteobacteria bacterium]|nr:MbcA/ParS/Xre antitoxin family protein [Gammaproteobacteria bacterium]
MHIAIQQKSRSEQDKSGVLTKAVKSVAQHLGLSNIELADILGISTASVTRLYRGRAIKEKKEIELAVLLVRLYRSLDAMVGGDSAKAIKWFKAFNHHLNGVPSERAKTVEGLVDVVQYLDAMRGKL